MPISEKILGASEDPDTHRDLRGAAGGGTGIANAQGGDQLASSWAQVNICSPTQLGARAQLAGDGSKAQMSVNFTAEWLSPSGWVALDGAASSPSCRRDRPSTPGARRAGPSTSRCPPGFAYQLRAVANLQWSGGRSQTIVTGTCSVGG